MAGRGWLTMGGLRRCLVTTTVLVAVLIGVPAVAQAGPAVARVSPVTHYAALGDSYSAGVGAQPGTGCGRNSLSYPALFKAKEGIPDAGFDFVACGGATTSDVRNGQLGGLTAQTDLVTITVGGNDIGFSPLLATCTLPGKGDAACLAAVSAAEAIAVFVLPVRLAATYRAMRQHAPRATVVVLGYPRLFEGGPTCADPVAPQSQARRVKLNHGADILDRVIKTTSALFGFRFVDVRPVFAGHGVCAPAKAAWINGPGVPSEVGRYHPNTSGYSLGYLPVLTSAAA